MLDVRHARALRDNYVWLLVGPDQRCAVVDPGESEPVLAALDEHGLTPAAILITHHHPDHVGGAEAIQDRFDVPMFGPDDDRVPGDSKRLAEGGRVEIEALDMGFDVLDIPGHTRSHIAFHGHGLLLSGDTLFSIGCGRLFEGTPAQMVESLDKLAALPGDTRIYCGHEYTLANCRFARQVEPDNEALTRHEARTRKRLDAGATSLPSTLDEELAANPFLRCNQAAVIEAAGRRAGRALKGRAEVFGEIRAWKDSE